MIILIMQGVGWGLWPSPRGYVPGAQCGVLERDLHRDLGHALCGQLGRILGVLAQDPDLGRRADLMATYQNIFTQIQVKAPPEMGIPLPAADEPRTNLTGYNYWLGKIGQAQLGPIYLGWLGMMLRRR